MAGKETSALIEFLGDKPKWRILDFMLENRLSDFTKTEIAKGAGLSWAALYQHWGNLERKKIVKLTRAVGRARLYQLNEASPLVALIKSMESTLIREAADEEEEAAQMKVSAKVRRKQ